MSATTSTAVAKKDEEAFPGMLVKFKGEIERALPAHLNADRMARIGLTEFRKNPTLGKCDPKSVFASIIVAAQLGIEPGIMGQGYLIPYKDRNGKYECQFVPGWQGLADLVARAGRASVWTGAVFDGDHFEYALGDRPFVTHRPCGEDDVQKLLFVYAIGRIKGAEWPIIEVWTAEKVERHLKKYNKVGEKHYAYNHFEMYARKVVLLQVIKYMPKSVELQTAANLEYAAEKGKQGIDLKDAVDGTWVPNEENEEPSNGDGGSRAESMKEKLRGGQSASASADQKQPDSDSGDAAQHFDKAGAIQALKNAGSLADLEKAWAAIALDYTQTIREVEPEVDETYKARKKELAQR